VLFSFVNTVSEGNYYDIIRCIDHYTANRASAYEEREVIVSMSLPLTYDICEIRENIRKVMTFGDIDNEWLLKATTAFLNDPIC